VPSAVSGVPLFIVFPCAQAVMSAGPGGLVNFNGGVELAAAAMSPGLCLSAMPTIAYGEMQPGPVGPGSVRPGELQPGLVGPGVVRPGPGAAAAMGGSRGSKAPKKREDDDAGYTTVMLRNIPNKYTQQMLIEQLHRTGFQGEIDYLYLPIDFANRCNCGYCFVNFRTVHARARFVGVFDNVAVQSCLPGFNSYKVCQVTRAKWQGRDENVRRLRSGPELMAQLAAHPEWLPMLLDEQGLQEPFPVDAGIQAPTALPHRRQNRKGGGMPGAGGMPGPGSQDYADVFAMQGVAMLNLMGRGAAGGQGCGGKGAGRGAGRGRRGGMWGGMTGQSPMFGGMAGYPGLNGCMAPYAGMPGMDLLGGQGMPGMYMNMPYSYNGCGCGNPGAYMQSPYAAGAFNSTANWYEGGGAPDWQHRYEDHQQANRVPTGSPRRVELSGT